MHINMIVGKIKQYGKDIYSEHPRISNQYSENLKLEIEFTDEFYDGYSFIWLYASDRSLDKSGILDYDAITKTITLPKSILARCGIFYISMRAIKDDIVLTSNPTELFISRSINPDATNIPDEPGWEDVAKRLIEQIFKNEYETILNKLVTDTQKVISDVETKLASGFFNGKDGTNGKDGINGKDGVDGLPGKDGINGTNGVDGKDGAIGPIGLTGLQGPPGEQGIQGIPGTPGANGKDGTKGDKGDTGLTGPKGDPGETIVTEPTIQIASSNISGTAVLKKLSSPRMCYLFFDLLSKVSIPASTLTDIFIIPDDVLPELPEINTVACTFANIFVRVIISKDRKRISIKCPQSITNAKGSIFWPY